jgi:hypothetical protein
MVPRDMRLQVIESAVPRQKLPESLKGGQFGDFVLVGIE